MVKSWIISSAGEAMGKMGIFTATKSLTWYSHLGEQSSHSALRLLGFKPQTNSHICPLISVFTATLFEDLVIT